jgi:hypothetical protein
LNQLPSIQHAFPPDSHVLIFSANGHSFKELFDHNETINVVGCEEIDGFDAITYGATLNYETINQSIVSLAKNFIKTNKKVRAILIECTQLSVHSDSLKYELGLPVYDAITNCDFFMSGMLDNKMIGLNDWQNN